MSRTTVVCPRCQASLSADQMPTPGKKVKCLKCGERFLANGNGRYANVPVAAPFVPPPVVPAAFTTTPPSPISPAAAPVALGFAPPAGRVAARKRGLILSLVLGGLTLFLVGGTALAVYCFALSDHTPKDNNNAALVSADAPPDDSPPPDVPAKQQPPKEQKPAPVQPAPAPQGQLPKDKPAPPPVQVAQKRPDPHPPVPPSKQALINKAIDRGVEYLKARQHADGSWDQVGGHMVGPAALCGLTLLECGVSRDDNAVQKAAKYVRFQAPGQFWTYDSSLAILFLDKLGDPKDKRLIQTLAARLIAGQNEFGGWTYQCRGLTSKEDYELLTFLRQHQPALPTGIAPGGGLDTPIGIASKPGGLPTGLDKTKPGALPEGIAPGQNKSLPTFIGPKDKSGTLPAGIPAGDKTGQTSGNPGSVVIGPFESGEGLKKPDQAKPGPSPNKDHKPAKTPAKKHQPRLRPEQLSPRIRSLPVLGGRTIPQFVKGPKGRIHLRQPNQEDNSNSQFAMIALWVARRHDVPVKRTMELVERRYHLSQHPDGGWSYHTQWGKGMLGGWVFQSRPSMTCVGLIGLAIGHGSAEEMRAAKPGKKGKEPASVMTDRAIKKGLKKLGTWIGRPTGNPRAQLTMDLYALWSVERVAVLYDLKTIGGNDWYGWAVEMLLPNQHPDGSWQGPGYPGGGNLTVDTCFALLILKRANLVQDLSDNLRLTIAITDPDAGPGRR